MAGTDVKERRGFPRHSLLLMVHLQGEEGQYIGPARVRNLSAQGMMAESNALLTEGNRLHFSLRSEPDMGGVVRWARHGRVGVQFDRLIDPLLARRSVAGAPQLPVAPAKPTSFVPTQPRKPVT